VIRYRLPKLKSFQFMAYPSELAGPPPSAPLRERRRVVRVLLDALADRNHRRRIAVPPSGSNRSSSNNSPTACAIAARSSSTEKEKNKNRKRAAKTKTKKKKGSAKEGRPTKKKKRKIVNEEEGDDSDIIPQEEEQAGYDGDRSKKDVAIGSSSGNNDAATCHDQHDDDEQQQPFAIEEANLIGLDFTSVESSRAFHRFMSTTRQLKSLCVASLAFHTTSSGRAPSSSKLTQAQRTFVDAFRDNTSLTAVNFYSIDPVVFEAVLPALEEHPNVRWMKIDLDNDPHLVNYSNAVNDAATAAATRALQDFLENNVTRVEHFMLSKSGQPSRSSIGPILTSLGRNTTVTKLHIVDSALSGEAGGGDDSDSLGDFGGDGGRRRRHRRSQRFVGIGDSDYNDDDGVVPVGIRDAIALKETLRRNTTVEKLVLTCNSLNNVQFRHVAEGLYRNSTLRILDLAENQLHGLEAATTLRALIQRNRSITSLDVSCNHFGGTQGFRLIAQALRRNTALEDLSMCSLRMMDEDVSLICRAIRENPQSSIRALSLAENALGPAAIETLIETIRPARPTSKLETLCVSGNRRIGPEGAQLLASCLRRPECTLKLLLMDRTGMVDAGLTAISEALEVNTTLEYFSMDDNFFTTEGMTKLISCLPKFSLKRIDFHWNAVLPSSLAEDFLNGLAKNTSLTQVVIGGWDVPHLKDRIKFYTERNLYAPLLLVDGNDDRTTCPPSIWPHCLANLLSKTSTDLNDESNRYAGLSVAFLVLQNKLPYLLQNQVRPAAAVAATAGTAGARAVAPRRPRQAAKPSSKPKSATRTRKRKSPPS